MPRDAPPNGSAQALALLGSGERVAGMQAKLHRWAAADPGRRFDDLFNLVHDPATLFIAFCRVAGNQGANTPGVDGITTEYVGFRLQWRRKKGTAKWYVYTLIDDRPIRSLKAKIRALTPRTSQLDTEYF